MIHVRSTSLNCSHITITDKTMMGLLSEGAWLFLNSAYRQVPGGFLSFSNEADMIKRSTVWYLVYDGEAPTADHIDWHHVYGFTVYRQRLGLKAVAFAKQAIPKVGTVPYRNDAGREITEYTMETETNNASARAIDFRKRRESAVKAMMKDACERGWCEVSGKPEEMLLSMGAVKIPAQRLVDANAFGGHHVKICDDGYHYIRNLGGEEHMKIALGKGFRG